MKLTLIADSGHKLRFVLVDKKDRSVMEQGITDTIREHNFLSMQKVTGAIRPLISVNNFPAYIVEQDSSVMIVEEIPEGLCKKVTVELDKKTVKYITDMNLEGDS